MIVATAFAGGIAWLSFTVWQRNIGHGSLAARIGETFLPLTLAGIGYFAIAHALKLPQTREFLGALMRKRGN